MTTLALARRSALEPLAAYLALRLPRFSGSPALLSAADRLFAALGRDPSRSFLYAARLRRRQEPVPSGRRLATLAQLLTRAGAHGDAFAVVRDAVAAAGHDRDGTAVALLTTIAQEWIVHADGDAVLDRVRGLAELPGLAGAVPDLLLAVCARRSLIEPDVLARAADILADPALEPTNGHAALELHLSRYGVDDAAVQAAIRLAARPDAAAGPPSLRLAAILEAGGEHDRLVAYTRRLGTAIRALVPESPALAGAWLSLPGGDADLRHAAEATLERRIQVRAAQARLLADLTDPAQDWAIVGNAPAGRGSGQGAAIDRHVQVVRFNRFSVEPEFAPDFGRKTTLHVRPLWFGGGETAARRVVVTGLHGEILCRSWSAIGTLQARGHEVAFFPPDIQTRLVAELGRAPSAGLTFAALAADRRGGAPGVDHYGFSFTDQTQGGRIAHYFDAKAPSGRHAWSRERTLFEAITGTRLPAPPIVALRAERDDRLRIRFAGDHTGYHAGSDAVTAYFRQEFEAVGRVVEAHEDYDVVVVNGEGSMHHGVHSFHQKMLLLGEAVARRRPAFLVNTVWQRNGRLFDHVLRHLDAITVRERASQRDLKARHGIQAELRLDASFWAPVAPVAAREDFGGGTVVTDFYSRQFGNFVRMTGGLLKAKPYIDMGEYGWPELIASLRTASLLVTGRHHAVYAACRARLPFVAMAGNTHKIEGLIEASGLPIPIAREARELPGLIDWADRHRSTYVELFDWMEAQPRLDLQERLAALPIRRR
ncbi:glycosyltransferase family 29 protein [Prosthecodimorpha staleyi]|uniref:Glycosyltransferase family 29 protein n=1 Tax=Prosthecodimorpha staleyi TaxID=2840188 RepID=A0A947GJQ8_9HYPH|nr:glycosyltransferase family 29 protein [Prosthecodimorpha staleyi]MBT9292159.1 glycosyltransferase family 29 protein [Prosthecodimorpha staleyi]